MINSEHYTLAIIFMAVITFTVRYAFFSTIFTITLSPQFKNILTFTAPCVLTAMIVPIMFQHIIGGNSHEASETQQAVNLIFNSTITTLFNTLLNSSYFWASLFAIMSSLLIRQTLLVIVLSVSVFYGLRYIGLN